MTTTVFQSFEQFFYETKGTQYIQEVDWPEDLEIVTFRSDTCLLLPDQVSAHIKAKSQDPEANT